MKHCLVLAIAALFFLGSAQAQDHSLARFYNSHRGTAVTFKIGVSRGMMHFASSLIPNRTGDKDLANAKKIISNVHRIKVYVMESYEDGFMQKDLSALRKSLIKKDHFETLMEVRDKGAYVQVLNKGADDELGNVVMLIQDAKDVIIVHLHTTLKIDDINMLIDQFNRIPEAKGNEVTASL
jgi:hypothetical protein